MVVFYRNGVRYLFLAGGTIVATGLQLFKNAGAPFPAFLPVCIFLIGLFPWMVPSRKVQIDLQTKSILIRELGKLKSVPIESIRVIMRDDQEIVLKTTDKVLQLFHSDFDNEEAERQFLRMLSSLATKAEKFGVN